jgi:hypothetical protein
MNILIVVFVEWISFLSTEELFSNMNEAIIFTTLQQCSATTLHYFQSRIIECETEHETLIR